MNLVTHACMGINLRSMVGLAETHGKVYSIGWKTSPVMAYLLKTICKSYYHKPFQGAEKFVSFFHFLST